MNAWFRNLAVTAVVGGSMLAAASIPAQAADCRERVRKAEQRLHEAERKHSEGNKEVRDRRRDLERERAACNREMRNDHHDHDHK